MLCHSSIEGVLLLTLPFNELGHDVGLKQEKIELLGLQIILTISELFFEPAVATIVKFKHVPQLRCESLGRVHPRDTVAVLLHLLDCVDGVGIEELVHEVLHVTYILAHLWRQRIFVKVMSLKRHRLL